MEPESDQTDAVPTDVWDYIEEAWSRGYRELEQELEGNESKLVWGIASAYCMRRLGIVGTNVVPKGELLRTLAHPFAPEDFVEDALNLGDDPDLWNPWIRRAIELDIALQG